MRREVTTTTTWTWIFGVVWGFSGVYVRVYVSRRADRLQFVDPSQTDVAGDGVGVGAGA